MIYRVRATFRFETAQDLLRKLGDGTIGRQLPDGAEIVASLNGAVVAKDGAVEWTELCFCPTPLQHERATVLDAHFDEITTLLLSAHQQFEGTPFIKHLELVARRLTKEQRLTRRRDVVPDEGPRCATELHTRLIEFRRDSADIRGDGSSRHRVDVSANPQ